MESKQRITLKAKPLENRIAGKLKKKKKKLVIAESCTGGLISHRITNVPGSSKYFLGGIIAYSNELKISILNISSKTIQKYGAVSQKTALTMAEKSRRIFKSDIAVAITGIAGPGGGTKNKPVGLAFIAFVSGKIKKSRKVFFAGKRISIKRKFAEAALKMIWENV